MLFPQNSVSEGLDLRGFKNVKSAGVESVLNSALIFDLAIQPMLLCKAEGEIVKANAAAADLFGYQDGYLNNRRTEMIIAENNDPAYILQRHEVIYPPKQRPLGTGLEVLGKKQDGTVFPVEVGLNVFENNGALFALVLLTDISTRKEQEEQLKKSHVNLQYYTRELQASNFELENFAYVSSHDLLEPLRKINAFGTRLKALEVEKLTEQGADYLERILNASSRMESLVNDLLTFSRLSTRSQPFVPVDLNVILTEVLGDLEVVIENTNTTVNVEPLPVIEAEPTQMRQLFQNLLANSIKFRKEDLAPVINITCVKNTTDPGRELYEISFTDNGIGFDERYKDKIFNIFQTLAGRKYDGSGIGLSICRKIAIRHGGNIVARSEVKMGSVFMVSLPARQLAPPQK